MCGHPAGSSVTGGSRTKMSTGSSNTGFPAPAPGGGGLTRRSLLQRAAALGLAGSTLGALELLARSRSAPSPPHIAGSRKSSSRSAASPPGGARSKACACAPGPSTRRSPRSRSLAPRRRPIRRRWRQALGSDRVRLPVQPRRSVHDRLLRDPLLRTAARRHGRVAGLAEHMPRLLADPSATRSRRRCPGRPTSPRPTRSQQAALQRPGADRVQRHAGDAAQRLDRGHRRRAQLGSSAKAKRSRATTVGTPGSASCSTVTSRRLMFNQPGLPRAVAERTASAVCRNDQPELVDVDGLLRPAGRQQRAAADHDLPGRPGRPS